MRQHGRQCCDCEMAKEGGQTDVERKPNRSGRARRRDGHVTPGARVQAAIEILDAIGAGQAAEQALTRWARQSRFAGSKDRAAVRDSVFDVLRQRRLAAHLGGGESGRALMLGLLLAQGEAPEAVFTGEGYAPAPLSPEERSYSPPPPDRGTHWNLPDWLLTHFERSLGSAAEETALILQDRAPVTLRVNRRRTDLESARAALAKEGIVAVEVPQIPWALRVTTGARGLRNSAALRDGYVELQDAHSQALAFDLPDAATVLDFCAGGGGKALAIADAQNAEVFAHDTNPARMKDLVPRAGRAGVRIRQLGTADLAAAAPFDVVFCDAPCSGSGSWRRTPEMKWSLTEDRLADFTATQDAILRDAARLVAPGGLLAYATCSVLAVENEERVSAFLATHPGWTCTRQRRYLVTDWADGFFGAHFRR